METGVQRFDDQSARAIGNAARLGDVFLTTEAVLYNERFYVVLDEPRFLTALKITCKSLQQGMGRDDAWYLFGSHVMQAAGAAFSSPSLVEMTRAPAPWCGRRFSVRRDNRLLCPCTRSKHGHRTVLIHLLLSLSPILCLQLCRASAREALFSFSPSTARPAHEIRNCKCLCSSRFSKRCPARKEMKTTRSCNLQTLFWLLSVQQRSSSLRPKTIRCMRSRCGMLAIGSRAGYLRLC